METFTEFVLSFLLVLLIFTTVWATVFYWNFFQGRKYGDYRIECRNKLLDGHYSGRNIFPFCEISYLMGVLCHLTESSLCTLKKKEVQAIAEGVGIQKNQLLSYEKLIRRTAIAVVKDKLENSDFAPKASTVQEWFNFYLIYSSLLEAEKR